jgi:hypothetical protein
MILNATAPCLSHPVGCSVQHLGWHNIDDLDRAANSALHDQYNSCTDSDGASGV